LDRRLVTILAADAVGYSKYMARDEGAAYQALSQCRTVFDQKIEEYDGRIFGSAGDSIIAEFTSSVNAVQCAIDIQRRLADDQSKRDPAARLMFRMGINFGDVIVEGDNLLGDGVNIAARLETLSPANGICIAANIREHISGKVKDDFGYAGRHRLKNIDNPIEVWCWPKMAAPQLKRAAIKRNRFLVPSLMLATFAVAGFAYTYFSSALQPPTQPGKARLAVLPFANVSKDLDRDYFVDGITSDLITDLSKISALFVIARNSVFAFKGRTENPSKVAKDLGVRYILEGSVRSSKGRVRVNARLIDSTIGGQIWADRFDRKLGDIFALQDEVTGKIVSALKLRLTPEETVHIRKAKDITSPEAYDLFLRGFQTLRQFTPESIRAARVYFLKALTIDPHYARALAGVAFSYTSGGIFFSSNNNEEATLHALTYGKRALELDASLPQGHFALAVAYLRRGQHREALASARQSVRYDPNYSDGYAVLASILSYAGQGDEAEANIRRAMSLNPRYSAAYIDILGRALFVKGDYDAALKSFKKCSLRDPAFLTCRVFLAGILGIQGRKEDAEWQAQEILNLKPDFKLSTDVITRQFERSKYRNDLHSGLLVAGISK
jgi:adenylate cyclase